MPQSLLAEIPGRLVGAPVHTLAEIERICDALKVAVIDARELLHQRHDKAAAFEGAVRHAREMHTLLLETMLPLEPPPSTCSRYSRRSWCCGPGTRATNQERCGRGSSGVKNKDIATISESLRDALLAYAKIEPTRAARAVIAQRLFGAVAARMLLPQLDEIARSVRPREEAT